MQFAAGSGVIISADGLVLTNAHVVDGADVIQVRLSDERTIRADLVGTSPSHDIALVRLRDTTNLAPATLGSSDAMQVGDQVVAIGNALGPGDTPTVTTGIVSAKGRTLAGRPDDAGEPDADRRRHQPGQLGRPAAERGRQVVGINSAGIPGRREPGLRHRDRRHPPADRQLKTGQDTEVKVQAFLGITSADAEQLTPAEASQLGVNGKDGVVVVSVQPESAASDAGLKPGDLIRQVDGKAVSGPQTVRDAIRGSEPGATITIEVERDGQLTDAVLGRPRLAAGHRRRRRLDLLGRGWPTPAGPPAGGSIPGPAEPEVQMST